MLAIVIPAYKSEFLRETLKSIANQTNKTFHLYIGDDNSSDPIEEIVEPFRHNIPLTYVRFCENLGAKSLTKQWERCIELTKTEPYIWLFSDDDIMPPDAVERFYKTIENNKNQNYLYRFNLMAIDRNNNSVYHYNTKPFVETNYNFAINRLKGRYLSSVVEFIFHRNTYKKYGGFVEFPYAWCSDDATWIKFSAECGIYTIPGAPVQWRISGENISSDATYAQKLIPVLTTYTNWLLQYFKPRVYDASFLNNLLINIYRQTTRRGLPFSKEKLNHVHELYLNYYGVFGHYIYLIAWLTLKNYLLKVKLVKILKSIRKQ